MTFTRNQWWIAVAVLIGMGAAFIILFRKGVFRAEPAYAGKPLKHWCAEYEATWSDWYAEYEAAWRDHEREEIVQAIRAMGDDAVKLLVQRAFRGLKPSKVQKFYREIHLRLPRALQKHLPDIFFSTQIILPQEIEAQAVSTLHAIKPPARVLLPLLADSLHGSDQTRRKAAIFLLGAVGEGGEQAVPYLQEALRDRDYFTRRLAVQSLVFIGPAAHPAVPALVEALKDPAINERAIVVLGNIGPPAKIAVPQITEFLQSTNPVTRLNTAAALYAIDQRPAAFQVITNALGSRDYPSLRQAVVTLQSMGPLAKEAVPHLLRMLGEDDSRVWIALSALKRIAPEDRQCLPILLEKLQAKDSYSRLYARNVNARNAAAAIVRIDPKQPEAMAFLLEDLKKPRPPGDTFTMRVLGGIGPPAKAAIPVLQEALHDQNKHVREAAAKALRRIQAGSDQSLR